MLHADMNFAWRPRRTVRADGLQRSCSEVAVFPDMRLCCSVVNEIKEGGDDMPEVWVQEDTAFGSG